MFEASIIDPFDRSEMKHSAYLLLWLDHKGSSILYFLKKIKKKLQLLICHFIIDLANKQFVTSEIISEHRENNLRTYSASALTQSGITDHAKKYSKRKLSKSHCENSFKRVVGSSLSKLITPRNFRKGFYMTLYLLFHHFIVSASRGAFGCLFWCLCGQDAV